MSPSDTEGPADEETTQWQATEEDNSSTEKPSRRSRPVFVAIAILLVLLLAAGFWGPGTWSALTSSDSSLSNQTADGMTLFPVGERRQAPDIDGETLEGGHLALRELRGLVVVVNVWGSWCVPCREEAPDLARVARETRQQGVRFVGIDTRDNRPSARAFVRNFNIPYPSLFDPDGQLLAAFTGIIPIGAVPSTVVLDTNGDVAARVVGAVDYMTLRGLVDDVLSEGGERPSGQPREATR